VINLLKHTVLQYIRQKVWIIVHNRVIPHRLLAHVLFNVGVVDLPPKLEEAAHVCVEHNCDVPVCLEGQDVVGQLGGGALRGCCRLASLPLIRLVVDLDCLFKVAAPNPPFVAYGGGELCSLESSSSAPDCSKQSF
jgi:hypothetical protein